MEWLVIYSSNGDLHVVDCGDKQYALVVVKNILEGGDVPLDAIQIFEAKRKKIVIDVEGE